VKVYFNFLYEFSSDGDWFFKNEKKKETALILAISSLNLFFFAYTDVKGQSHWWIALPCLEEKRQFSWIPLTLPKNDGTAILYEL
jgi:hypothetical protein